MALPSSPNQISLGDIRTEYGLASGQIAMSSLYNKGNAPSSGEIQIGADFHGTSNATTLSTTMTVGVQQHKVAIENRGFMANTSRRHGVVMANGVANGAIGSLANTTTSTGGVVEAAYLRIGQNANGGLNLGNMNFILEMTVGSTSWTSITYNTTTLNRSAASTSDNQFFEWSGVSGTLPTAGNTATFSINA